MKKWLKLHKYTAIIFTGLLVILGMHLFIAYSIASAEPVQFNLTVQYTIEKYPDFNNGVAVYMRTGEIDPADPKSGYELVEEFKGTQIEISEETYNLFKETYPDIPFTYEEAKYFRMVRLKSPLMEFTDFINTPIATKGIDFRGNYTELSEGGLVTLPKYGPPTFIAFPE